MRRGTLSIDLLISVIVLLIVGEIFYAFSYYQGETALANNMKFKAESHAMAIGSAINHFAAINPESGSHLEMDLYNPEPARDDVTRAGWPYLGKLSFEECTLSFSDIDSGDSKYLMVNITFEQWDSGFSRSVIGRYPVVPNTQITGDTEINCSGFIDVRFSGISGPNTNLVVDLSE